MPQPNGGTLEGNDHVVPEIPLDAEARVVKRLLDAFTCDALPTNEVEASFPATKLAVMLGCTVAKERLSANILASLTPSIAWKAFALFAQLDNIEAARQALRAMDRSARRDTRFIKVEEADGIPLPYLIGLLRAVGEHPSAMHHYHTDEGERYEPRSDWKAISQAFKVAE